MKKGIINIIKSVGFLSILMTLILQAGIYLRPMDKDADCMNGFYSLKNNSIDVALIGSSALYRYWIPATAYEQQGFTSGMLYCASQNVDAIPYLIRELVKTQHPEIILVENRRLFSQSVQELDGNPKLDLWDYCLTMLLSSMHPSVNKMNMIHEILGVSWEEELEYMLPLLKYHENVYDNSMDELNERAKKDIAQNLIDLQLSVVEKQRFTIYDPEEYTDDELQQKYYEDVDQIVETAGQCGIKVVFLSTPYTSSARGQSMRAKLNEYMDQKGYDYIDLTLKTEEMGIDFETDFYNGAHTNVSGAEKVTGYLAEYLSDHYVFNTPIDETTRDYWNEYVSRWNLRKEELIDNWKVNIQSNSSAG